MLAIKFIHDASGLGKGKAVPVVLEAEWGAVMLSAAESVLKVTGGVWRPADRVEVEANQEFISSALGAAEVSAAQKKGRAMTLEQALAFASET